MFALGILTLTIIVLIMLHKGMISSWNIFTSLNCSALDCDFNDVSQWRVPRTIHRTWRDANLPPKFRAAWEHTARHNPGFEQVLHTDAEADAFMRQHCSPREYRAYQRINPLYGAARADLFRYVLLYNVGGVYLDAKSAANSLCSLVRKEDGFLLSPWSWMPHFLAFKNSFGEFQQWHIVCAPRHPFLQRVIDHVVHNIESYSAQEYPPSKHSVLRLTGPIAYTHAILQAINEGVTDYRTVCNDANKVFVYDLNGGHTRMPGLTHYSRLTAPLVLP
jgi:inositol phosphorylceramide mannosyltransferase catalytic subunit